MDLPPLLSPGTLAAAAQPVIGVGDGVRLRPFADRDAPAVLRAFSDPAIRRWNRRTMTTETEASAWIAGWAPRWVAETDACWAVVDNDDTVRGRVAVRDIDVLGGAAECTYWMLPDARGQGLATSAVQAVSRWAFTEIGFHRLTLIHATANEASCRVASKAGFPLEGTLRHHQLLDDGWHNTHLHARLHTDD